MTTITKERIELFIKNPLENGLTRGEQMELARIALASLEEDPVAWLHSDNGLGIPAITRSKNIADSWLSKGWYVQPLYIAKPVPVVPDARPSLNNGIVGFDEGWNACRAAMLHSAEPASNHEELPLDYLQGQKDGLEWAAQLAEANHPQTGDWLYDDPLELAKAIRKGPDMPEFDGPTPVTPDSWISCSERMPEKNQNVLISVNFDSDLVEPLICSARYTGSTFRRGEATIKPGNGIEQATHWMPLPEPPQEVNRG
ncbi:DUF551 domain-containing protein [Escherichia coli]|uniref:DUF551 domain-containing protein n=1 Tax=Escherichia coli TaxID=562 RepID=UPI0021B5C524|nr:DUF551 domain-containing protein [Escherichia coli]MCT7379786.1 DUF551 domain-containing protein [Escherichia coli]